MVRRRCVCRRGLRRHLRTNQAQAHGIHGPITDPPHERTAGNQSTLTWQSSSTKEKSRTGSAAPGAPVCRPLRHPSRVSPPESHPITVPVAKTKRMHEQKWTAHRDRRHAAHRAACDHVARVASATVKQAHLPGASPHGGQRPAPRSSPPGPVPHPPHLRSPRHQHQSCHGPEQRTRPAG